MDAIIKTLMIIVRTQLPLLKFGLYAQDAVQKDPLNEHKAEYYPNGKICWEYTLENGIVNGFYKF